MAEKYDLRKMLEEIKEDEGENHSRNRELSQDAIQKMMLERLKKKKAASQ